MHDNPVKRGLVAEADRWRWSSYRSDVYAEAGGVRINYQEEPVKLKAERKPSVGKAVPALSQKARKNGAPRGFSK